MGKICIGTGERGAPCGAARRLDYCGMPKAAEPPRQKLAPSNCQ